MAKYTTLSGLFTAIATSLRGKTGSTGKIVADDFPSVIDGIQVGITPSGTKSITTNGTHDVTSYASASVNVPVPSGYIKPSGTKSITTNGSHDVTAYATAKVEVPASGITPSGSIEIKENGTYDVTSKASAVVNVPTGGGSSNYHVLPITISSNLGAGTNTTHNLVTGDSFVKTNYANENFYAILFPVTPTEQTTESNYITFVYAGNRVIVRSKSIGYAIFVKGGGSSGYANGQINNYKISQSGYNVTLRANSSGNIILYVASSLTVPAGDYLLVYALAE